MTARLPLPFRALVRRRHQVREGTGCPLRAGAGEGPVAGGTAFGLRARAEREPGAGQKSGDGWGEGRAMLGGVETKSVSPVFVGRTSEFGTLNSALERAGAGEPQALLVAGEAGVGKTRLVEEFAVAARRKGAVIALTDDIEGYLRASEVSRDRVEDIRSKLKEGDTVTTMIINVDRKNRTINLSIKAKDLAEENEALARMQSERPSSAGTTNLGALLKAKLDTANSSSSEQ